MLGVAGRSQASKSALSVMSHAAGQSMPAPAGTENEDCGHEHVIARAAGADYRGLVLAALQRGKKRLGSAAHNREDVQNGVQSAQDQPVLA